jgi:hypothetical protein
MDEGRWREDVGDEWMVVEEKPGGAGSRSRRMGWRVEK